MSGSKIRPCSQPVGGVDKRNDNEKAVSAGKSWRAAHEPSATVAQLAQGSPDGCETPPLSGDGTLRPNFPVTTFTGYSDA